MLSRQITSFATEFATALSLRKPPLGPKFREITGMHKTQVGVSIVDISARRRQAAQGVRRVRGADLVSAPAGFRFR
jgi:hypothetical protein